MGETSASPHSNPEEVRATTDDEQQERNRLAQQKHRDKDLEQHRQYMRDYKAAHRDELAAKRREYKARKRAEKIASGEIVPREKKPKEDKPKRPPERPNKQPLTEEQKRERQKQYNAAYRERKRQEKQEQERVTRAVEPVPAERKLCVILGENCRYSDKGHCVISVYPLCSVYSCAIVSDGKLNLTYHKTADAAFRAACKFRLKRFRDISTEALQDYLKRGENNG